MANLQNNIYLEWEQKVAEMMLGKGGKNDKSTK